MYFEMYFFSIKLFYSIKRNISLTKKSDIAAERNDNITISGKISQHSSKQSVSLKKYLLKIYNNLSIY